MALQIVGAGVGRTGTNSLKLALEQLLGGPCYHMIEVFGRPEHVPAWHAAYTGGPVDWPGLFADFRAAVDWPAAGRWRQLAAAFPDAPVLLSTRNSADEWFASADGTIFEVIRRSAAPANTSDGGDAWRAMAGAMMHSFSPAGLDRASAIDAYERHNAEVRAEVPAARLVEWRPGDGWEPLCRALGVAVPGEPFPHVNTSAEFRAHAGWD